MSPVDEGLGQVRPGDFRCRIEVRDRPGDLEYALAGAGRQAHPVSDRFKELFLGRGQVTDCPDLGVAQLRVGHAAAFQLAFACGDNPFANRGTGFPVQATAVENSPVGPVDLDMQVDAVQ